MIEGIRWVNISHAAEVDSGTAVLVNAQGTCKLQVRIAGQWVDVAWAVEGDEQ